MSDIGGGSMWSRNSVADSKSRRNAISIRVEIGWKHGTDVRGDGKIVKCNYCTKIVSGGMSEFKYHLAGAIEDPESCVLVPDEVKALMMKIVVEEYNEAYMRKRRKDEVEQDDEENHEMDVDSSERKSGGVHPTVNQMMKNDLKEKVDQQVARFFYTSAIPFDCIKNVEFVKMCEMIGRYGIGYRPPPYQDIGEKLLNQAVTRTDEMLEEFRMEWKRTGCSILCDTWTDDKGRSICNFLANSPKGTVFLYSLDTSDISKTTQQVFKMFDDVVTFVGEENVVQVVTNNATNYKTAGEMLMQKRKNMYWTPCATHCIDLILEDFGKNLKLHQVTIKK